jgi:hypothetical protein
MSSSARKAFHTRDGDAEMKSALAILLLVAACEVVGALVWDRLIVREENCDAGEAALCLVSIFFIQPEHEDRPGIKELERHYRHLKGH